MTNSEKDSSNAEYDEILSKLDTLLRKHQGAAKTHADVCSSISTPAIALEPTPLTSVDDIPTLTETVHLTPAMLSPQSDITSLLAQILNSALKDAGAELDNAARKALVQALERRLFGL